MLIFTRAGGKIAECPNFHFAKYTNYGQNKNRATKVAARSGIFVNRNYLVAARALMICCVCPVRWKLGWSSPKPKR